MKKHIVFLLLINLFIRPCYASQASDYLTKWRIAKWSVVAGIVSGLLIKPKTIYNYRVEKKFRREVERNTPNTNPEYVEAYINLYTSQEVRTVVYETASNKWNTEHPDGASFDTVLRVRSGAAICIATAAHLSIMKLLLRCF